jgi:hypothetical protein
LQYYHLHASSLIRRSPAERIKKLKLGGGNLYFIFVGCILLRYLRILYEHIIYICNPQSQLFLFRLLPHYMFRPLRAIFRRNKCININSVFVKTIMLSLIHPLLHVLLSMLYYLSINSYIIFFKIA